MVLTTFFFIYKKKFRQWKFCKISQHCSFILEDRRESRPYDALLILTEQKEVQAQGFHYYLPDEVQVKPINKLLGRRKQTFELIFLKPNHKEQIEFLCPVDIQGNTRHKSVIRKSTKHYSGFQYCLIKEEFPNKTITCKSEAIPLVVPLVSRDTKKIMKCGPNQAYEFLQFAYPVCVECLFFQTLYHKHSTFICYQFKMLSSTACPCR